MLVDYATKRVSAIPGVRIIGTAQEKASVLSFIVEDPPISTLDIGTQLDLEGVAVRTGHHCCQPLMERFGIAGTARASFAMYNTLEEVDVLAETLERIVASVKPRRVAPAKAELVFPSPAAGSPEEAAGEIAEVFDAVDDWTEKYQHLIEIGSKLLPMPAVLKTEANRVQGCQSTVFMHAQKKQRTPAVVHLL